MHHRLHSRQTTSTPSRQSTDARALTVSVRPGRLAAAGLTLVLAAALLLAWAAAAQASVWVIPAADRAYPGTKEGPRKSIAIDAAGNEYQGVQVCVRGGGNRHVSFTWSSDSDPLITANTKLHRVYYVKVTTPTTALHSRRGWYPDPLVPLDFGEGTTAPGAGNPGPTTPFYLLTHVPYGTPGTRDGAPHTATLRVRNGDETVDIPFSLRVWDFGWSQISTGSAFAVSQKHIKRSVAGKLKWSGDNKERVLTAFYQVMQEHGLSPTVVHRMPQVSGSGHAKVNDWATKAAPYLSTDGLNLHDNQLPWLRWFPWGRSKNPSASKVGNYLADMCRIYKERGWHKKAYVYIIDETTRRSEERKAERYARLAHKASAKSGYRIRFLLTDDPRPKNLGGVKQKNTFLYDDVDIWALRYYYFFGRIPAVRERKAAGKEIWWYSYTNGSVSRTPSFVIDKPHIDSRVWGWMMEEWNVDGLLNWGFNRWGQPKTGNGWRDPYKQPLSFSRGKTRSNGDTCLVYPGYYPRYGLRDPYAPPVSSLRLEALRDGLEEREYLEAAKRAGGAGLANQVLNTITQFHGKIQNKNVFVFPKYTKSNSVFDRARVQLGEFIESRR